MTTMFKFAFNRFFADDVRPEPVHFHSGDRGHAIVCHDDACTSPRLDLRDARAARAQVGDLR